ncbi:MAG: helix-turn-helix domain-containing protein [Desulfobacteraceae bacterium]|nr:helix-turn-helix domain-containing protein [Desulfobacteraceae bacterium]
MRAFYKVAEAAEALGVSVSTVRRWIKSGRLPALKVNATLRIPADFVDRLARGDPPPAKG